MLIPKTNKHNHLDHLGMGVSLLCAVHCALLPIVLALIPVAGLQMLKNGYIEIAIIGTSLALACLSLGKSYRRHRNKLPLLMVGIGFIAIACGHFLMSAHFEWLPLTVGGILIAAAHWYNRKLNLHCTAIK